MDQTVTTASTYVVEVLKEASSQDPKLLKPAEAQLKSWENQPGFYNTLLTIFTNKEIEVNVRWIAVLYLKNGIDRYWRRHAVGGISAEEKASMRAMLVCNFHEPVNQLAIQLAVIIGKIARIDCPAAWPELVPSLVQALFDESLDILQKQRVLLTLYQVIKTLSSRRLPHDRRIFEELSQNITSTVLRIWADQSQQLMASLNNPSVQLEACQITLEYTRLSLKVLRKLVALGFKLPSDKPELTEFIQSCFSSIHQLLSLELNPALSGLSETLEKLLLLYSKIIHDMLMYHSEFFINFIETSLNMVALLCFSPNPPNMNSERFIINSMNLMKSILIHDDYRVMSLNLSSSQRDDDCNRLAALADTEKRKVLNYRTLPDMLHVLVQRHLVLKPNDLELWENDPEELVNEGIGDSWKYSYRACVETLFSTLFQSYKETLAPDLLKIISANQQVRPNPDDLQSVLERDALYNAVGLAAYEIYDELDFDAYLQNTIVPELDVQHSQYRIVRRRVVWLIGQWVGVKMSVSLRPLVYRLIVSLLGEDEDLVVRVEAANALKSCVDDYEFTADLFAPYLESAFRMLYSLLVKVESCDSKMQILNVMSFLIEREGAAIFPHVGVLAEHLPLLWESAGEHDMLRSAIVSTLQPLVDSLGKDSPKIYSVALPVIGLAVDLDQKAHIYLLEDGLLLWEIILYNAVEMSPDLLQMFAAMPRLLEMSSENLRLCVKIMEAYVLLAPDQLIQAYGGVIVQSLIDLFTDMKSEGMILILRLIETMFIVQARQSALMFHKMFTKRIIPNLLAKEDYPMVVSLYLCLISRLVLENPSLFFAYISEYASENSKQEEAVVNVLMQTWFEKLDCISQPERRKVCALAIASLLPSPLSLDTARLDCMVNACVQVLHDICDDDEDSGDHLDTLVLRATEPELSDDELDSEHMKRKNKGIICCYSPQLCKKDPVFHVPLNQYVREKLNQLQAQLGSEKFQLNLNSIDPDILSQLNNFMKPPG